VRLFADDCLVHGSIIYQYSESSTTAERLRFPKLMGKKILGMRFNIKKGHIMHIKNLNGPRFYQLDNTIFCNVPEAKNIKKELCQT